MNIEVGMSASTAQSGQTGDMGDFNLSGGGTKANIVMYIVAGVVLLIAVVAWLKFR